MDEARLDLFGENAVAASQAFHTFGMLAGFYHGFGAEGPKFVENLFTGLINGSIRDRPAAGQ